jgi:chaperonin GroES
MIEPCGDYLVVKPIQDSVSKGGILLVQGEKAQRPDKGEVVAVGPGAYQNGMLIPMRTHKGDVIYFAQYPNFDVTHDGQKYVMVREGQVCGVVKG